MTFPYTFANIIGQEKAKVLLGKALRKGTLGHAYLFRGPAGVGKKRTALTMAAAINCQAPRDIEACGICPACRKLAAGSHPDLLTIQPDGAVIKINQIRELKHALTLSPFEARFRVIILEDVHTMRREAANSLLKTLEEPPADNILILTADDPGDLLPTIISRCQVIAFHALPYEAVARALMAESDLTAETAATLAAVAEGSLGRAKLLLDRELLDLRQAVVDNLTRHLPGQPEAVPAILRLAESAADLKENLTEFLGMLRLWFRDLLLLKAGGPESLMGSRDLREFLPAAAKRWSLSDLFARLAMLDRAERELGRNCNRTQVCEVLFFGLL